VFHLRIILGLVLASTLQGCLYPETPSTGVVSETIPTSLKGEWNKMTRYTHSIGVASKSRTSVPRKRSKNLLFIAADNQLGDKLGPELKKMYNRDVRLEDALWWYYAPKIQKTYNYVLRIHWDGFNAKSFDAALSEMEKLKTPYDVMLLVHGSPTRDIIASPEQGLIGATELAEFRGVQYADTLYLQACFGDLLAQDLLDIGFQKVIASEGFSINLFFPDIYLDALSAKLGNTEKAHKSAVDHFETRFKWSPLYNKIVEKVFKDDPQIKGDPKLYLKYLKAPEIYYR